MTIELKPKHNPGDHVFILLGVKVTEMVVIEATAHATLTLHDTKEPKLFQNTVYTLAPATVGSGLVSISAQKEEVFATKQELLDSL